MKERNVLSSPMKNQSVKKSVILVIVPQFFTVCRRAILIHVISNYHFVFCFFFFFLISVAERRFCVPFERVYIALDFRICRGMESLIVRRTYHMHYFFLFLNFDTYI